MLLRVISDIRSDYNCYGVSASGAIFSYRYNSVSKTKYFDKFTRLLNLTAEKVVVEFKKILDYYVVEYGNPVDKVLLYDLYHAAFYIASSAFKSADCALATRSHFFDSEGVDIFFYAYTPMGDDVRDDLFVFLGLYTGENIGRVDEQMECLDESIFHGLNGNAEFHDIIWLHIKYLFENNDFDGIETSYSHYIRANKDVCEMLIDLLNTMPSGFIRHYGEQIHSILLGSVGRSGPISDWLLELIGKLKFKVKVGVELYFHPVLSALRVIAEASDIEMAWYANKLLADTSPFEAAKVAYSTSHIDSIISYYKIAPLELLSYVENYDLRCHLIKKMVD